MGRQTQNTSRRTADNLLPPELRRLILEFVPYPDRQDSRVDIHAADFPFVTDAMLRADRGRHSNVHTLCLVSTYAFAIEPMSPENERSLERLLGGLRSLRKLDVYCGYYTPQLWNRILCVLQRLEVLIFETTRLFSDADADLHRRIADSLMAARRLRGINAGSLQTHYPHGRAYNLGVIADAIVARGCWEELSLEIVPGVYGATAAPGRGR
jgi:hypothetical protein